MKLQMTFVLFIVSAVSLVADTGWSEPQLIAASLATSGVEPNVLTGNILDANSDYTLAGPTIIRIKNQQYSYVTDTDALGLFGQGTVAAGTSMA